jgi:D-glycero-D-manno-heptose 1,7-bisphosphate phosphatase
MERHGVDNFERVTPSKQAVILAGGRGLRLRPLTDHIPKPMIPFHGRPFLNYLIELLKNQGLERVLILLGYMAEKVQDYLGDGSALGIRIDYCVSPEEDETGTRMRRVQSCLDPYFVLLYCDNYWPMEMTKMWARFSEIPVPAMLTVYRNQDGYTKNNVRVDENGYIIGYDKSRLESGLNGVEIGYGILSREVLDILPSGNESFEATVYPELARRRLLRAFPTSHRYYSIGSLERLPVTEAFLSFPQAIFLDRDGVINKRPSRAEYVRGWEEFEWLPGAVDAIRLLKDAGYKVIVVTNQAGVARGVMLEADVQSIHDRMQAELRTAGAAVDAFYYCPHGWNDGCFCRKPKPGMFFQAQRDHHLDLTRTIFIGDDERDLEAGRAAGCRTYLVSREFPVLDCVRRHLL